MNEQEPILAQPRSTDPETLDNLGFKLSDSTVDNIRHRSGLDPAPPFSRSADFLVVQD
jgi:hypothetical protein